MAQLKNFTSAKSPVSEASQQKFVDIDLRFNRHPATNDLSVKVGSAAVSQSLRNICLTNAGDIDEDSAFGVGIRNYLGEQFGPIEVLALKQRILDQCARYEPRAEIFEVLVDFDEASYTLRVRINYFVVNVLVEESVIIEVSRVL